VVRAVLDALGSIPGCRLAEPGEFARRAFRYGKRDLAALEGLADLIEAETEAQRRQALAQMSGALGRQVAVWSERLLALQAELEAELDFSDEADVMTDMARARAEAAALQGEMAAALAAAPAAERVRDGFRVVIAGPPNVGKSSLFNALARRDAAIVTDIPGTTRDVLDLQLDMCGLAVILSDTAGLRETVDPVEQEGVRRAAARIREADLTLWLTLDGRSVHGTEGAHLVVATQRDRFGSEPAPDWADHAISVVTGAGLERLLNDIAGRAQRAAAGGDSALVVRARHARALEEACVALGRAAGTGIPELIAEDCRLARRSLARIVGTADVESVLDAIFGRFCIGK
jgi:tRNA modification GTPase